MIDILGQSSDFSHEDAVRLRRVEQKIDLILAKLGIDYTETWNLSTEREHGPIKGTRSARSSFIARRRESAWRRPSTTLKRT